MSDYSKHQVADRLAAVNGYERCIAELRRQGEDRERYIRELVEENDQQHRDNRDLARELASTCVRLDRALEEARKLRAVRTRDWSGLLMLAFWKLTRRL